MTETCNEGEGAVAEVNAECPVLTVSVAAPEFDNDIKQEVEKKRKRAIKKVKRNTTKQTRIMVKQREIFKDGLKVFSATVHGAPEVKPDVKVAGADKASFTIADYVFVAADISPGMNCLVGYGYVESVQGRGVKTITTVVYDKASDDGATHLPADSPLTAFHG